MSLDLSAVVPDDGTVKLQWKTASNPPDRAWVLAVRTGARPGFTSVMVDGRTREWTLQNLGRHQRYRFMVMGRDRDGLTCSPWLNVTPRHGLAAETDDGLAGPAVHQAQVARLVVMPQDQQLTAYWTLTPGFCERVCVEVMLGEQRLHAWELEPEVHSLAMDAVRAPLLRNGVAVTVRAHAVLAGLPGEVRSVVATPAPTGREREFNREHPQAGLVYACMALTPEVDVFNEGTSAQETQPIRCGHCGAAAAWQDYALKCTGCRAEFISNGRGAFLDVARLRFGTCKCCLPRKLLVQDVGSPSLRCVHSGKEYIRVNGMDGYVLTEDLPFGLCQCCRPRRPLLRAPDGQVRCCISSEVHVRAEGDSGGFMLVPSAPVFDASVIDDLLDAGMADICASGVSRGARR